MKMAMVNSGFKGLNTHFIFKNSALLIVIIVMIGGAKVKGNMLKPTSFQFM